MNREHLLRRTLLFAAVFNVAGAVLFAFPAFGLGPLAGLPAEVPITYRAFTAAFILQFAGAYAYLGLQPTIQRPFVAFGAIGKTIAFLLGVALFAGGQIGAFGVALLGGDLVFAALFTWGLLGIPSK